MLFMVLPTSLFYKNAWSSPIIYLFLFIPKGRYIVGDINLVTIIRLLKYFSLLLHHFILAEF